MKTTPFRFGVGVTGLAIIIDQASKFWILTIFEKSPLAITVTPFFNIVQTWNRGISFGLFFWLYYFKRNDFLWPDLSYDRNNLSGSFNIFLLAFNGL